MAVKLQLVEEQMCVIGVISVFILFKYWIQGQGKLCRIFLEAPAE